MSATDLLRTAAAARTPTRTRYLIARTWESALLPPEMSRWTARAVEVPVYFDGVPLRRIPEFDPVRVEVSDLLDSWDEAAAWCDAHHRGLL